MSAEKIAFRYTGRLPDDETHIRLVLLEPDTSGPIRCRVIQTPLSKSPDFEAVSYCWGDPHDTAEILCDGQHATIPANLHAFLLRTRAKGRVRTLWIDSICINQADDVEKGAQVLAMRAIYSKAVHTLIWLGPAADNSRIGLEFGKTLADEFRLKAGNPQAAANPPWYAIRERSKTPTLWHPGWVAFFRLMDREWFRRAWVVQEVAVAGNAWVTCGDKALSWVDMVYALVCLTTYHLWVVEFYSARFINQLIAFELSRQEVATGEKRMHHEMLARHRVCDATDPRDKIFAFYGLSAFDSLMQAGITPNYKQQVERQYRDVAVSTLRNTRTLDLLSVPRLRRPAGEKGREVPTWVPDWSCADPLCFSLLRIGFNITGQDTEKLFTSSKNSTWQPIFDGDFEKLQLSGFIIDRVNLTSQTWELQFTTGYQSIRQQALVMRRNQRFIQNWKAIAVTSMDTGGLYIPTGETLREAFWQICVGGWYYEKKDETRLKFDAFERRQRHIRVLYKLGVQDFVWAWMLVVMVGHFLRLFGIMNPEMAFRSVVEAMIQRRVARTTNGYLGLLPDLAEEGDYIALCRGGKLPLVLRPCGENWELIGDCYLHGVTKGELWQDEDTKCRSIWLE